MTTGDFLKMLVVDALVILGFLAGGYFLYLALTQGTADTEVALTLGAIAFALIPLPVAVITHNQIMRRRLPTED